MGFFSSIGKVVGSLIPGVGPLGGAIGGTIGGLIDGKREDNANEGQSRTAENANRDRFVRLREDAEKAGFNPITALENGGLSTAGTTYQKAPLASLDMIAGNIRDLGMELTGEAAQERGRQKLVDDLEKEKLENLRLNNGALRSVINTASTIGRQPTSTVYSANRRNATASLDPIVQYSRDRQSVQIGGRDVSPNLGWSNADDVETRYGEIGSSFYGLGVGIADFLHSTRVYSPSISPRPISREYGGRIETDADGSEMYVRPPAIR